MENKIVSDKSPAEKAWDTMRRKSAGVKAANTKKRKEGAKKTARKVKNKQWEPEKIKFLLELRNDSDQNVRRWFRKQLDKKH